VSLLIVAYQSNVYMKGPDLTLLRLLRIVQAVQIALLLRQKAPLIRIIFWIIDRHPHSAGINHYPR